MYKKNPHVQRLYAISQCKGMDPFYYEEVKGIVHHPTKLIPLVQSGWVDSAMRSGERIRIYQMTQVAYWRVNRLFAADIEEEVPVQEEHRTTPPVFQEDRITRMIQSIWEHEPQDDAKTGYMEVAA